MSLELVDEALKEWEAGRYYEAHEILEDVAETFEADDPAFEQALALTRAAACLHKLAHDVGAKAVPGKLAAALETLRTAPDTFLGLNMEQLVQDLEVLARAIGDPMPRDLEYPVPRRHR